MRDEKKVQFWPNQSKKIKNRATKKIFRIKMYNSRKIVNFIANLFKGKFLGLVSILVLLYQ